MRKLNDMFHIDGERLIKTSNSQPVPEDEPLFILRGRDKLAIAVISLYREHCRDNGTPTDRLEELANVINKFEQFADERSDKLKLPGSTHGGTRKPAMELALEPERVMAWCARWRRFLGLSLKDIESYTGISAAKLSRAELGSARLNLSERFVLYDFLGCELQKEIAAGGRIFVPTPSGAEFPLRGRDGA